MAHRNFKNLVHAFIKNQSILRKIRKYFSFAILNKKWWVKNQCLKAEIFTSKLM